MENQDKWKQTTKKKKKDRNSQILTEAMHILGTVTENPRAISRIAKNRPASLESIGRSAHPSGSGHFDFGHSNSGFWGRRTTRQYLRPGQVIIGSTLVPGRLVNRARVHAPLHPGSGTPYTMTSLLAGNMRVNC
ncbi:hypothetical protein N7455_003527 [Penicillium solitum]|uniref:uncharacterized protein n=1 Tax=Penicillium solitum TaxID=60172 RepID=UPI0032C3ED8D|nr:hypothetical protein N7455_003527 [Penicillium solitum]